METVILAPVLLALALFVVYAGRSTQAMAQIRHAADQGARAASMVRQERMPEIGRQAVLADLRENGNPCSNVLVNVAINNDAPTKTVLVEIECEITRVGLQLLSLNRRTIEAKSIEVIDVWRVD